MKYKYDILLVEDNEGDVRILRELLGEQSLISCRLNLAGSIAEFNRLIDKARFDIVLLDLGLPDSSGFETFSTVAGRCPAEISIIILTGLNDNDTGLAAVNKGAQDYLVKGRIDSDMLVKSILYSYERNRLKIEFNKQLEETRKVEAELLQSKDRLDLIATRTSAVMYQTGGDGATFMYLHDAFSTLTGYSISEISKVGFESVIRQVEKPGGEPVRVENLKRLWSNKVSVPLSLEYLLETKEGELKWISDKSYPLSGDDENNSGAIGILMDICSSKEAETEILAQKEKSDQLFLNSPVGIVQLDHDGVILNVNNSFESMFGFSSSEVIGEKLDALIVPPQLSGEADALTREAAAGHAVSEVSYRMKRDESLIYVSIAGVPVKKKGKVVGSYAMYIDLTKQKLAEEALIKARNKAEESDRLKTAFLHNISHEIRTPLNAIVGFSSLLAETAFKAVDKTEFVETIISSSNHLLEIINDIVEISNLEANLVKISASHVDIGALISEVFTTFISKAQEKGIGLKISISETKSDFIVVTDKTKLYQVLANLVGNAIKFTKKGNVEFGYRLKENQIEFFVSDTGIGIPAELTEKVFDRFYQVEASDTREYEGTGLGLSISKGYVELLAGNIWVQSVQGKGSDFYFTLPLTKSQSDRPGGVEIKRRVNGKTDEKRRILVAEDVESNFRLIEIYLSDLQAEILWAINGREAIETLNTTDGVDLVLMDIKMPVMDGFEAIKKIRDSGSAIPIIAQTAYADDLEKALDIGCDEFLSKPFRKEELLSVIRKYI